MDSLKSADEIISSVLPGASEAQLAAIDRYLEASHRTAFGRRRALIGVLGTLAAVWLFRHFMALPGWATPDFDAFGEIVMKGMLAIAMSLSLIMYVLMDIQLHVERKLFLRARLPNDAVARVLAMARSVRMVVYVGPTATRLLARFYGATRR